MFDGSGDKKFLVVEEQDSTCLLNSTITIFPQSTWHVMLKHKKFTISRTLTKTLGRVSNEVSHMHFE